MDIKEEIKKVLKEGKTPVIPLEKWWEIYDSGEEGKNLIATFNPNGLIVSCQVKWCRPEDKEEVDLSKGCVLLGFEGGEDRGDTLPEGEVPGS